MKPKLPILLLACLCGCEAKVHIESKPVKPLTNSYALARNPQQGVVEVEDVQHKRTITIYDDFVMGSWSAVSNAMLYSNCAPGFTVMCDNKGYYAPAKNGFPIGKYGDITTRTSHWEAIVATWRVKEVWDTPAPPKLADLPSWTECK